MGRSANPTATVVLVGLLTAMALAAAPSQALAKKAADPHAALLQSRLGCLACHGSSDDIFGLLEGRSTKLGEATDEACLGCHTGGGSAPQVYGGSADAYLTRSGRGHNDPAKVSCVDCHAVHGKILRNDDGITDKLLKDLDYQREAVKTYDPRTAPHDEALSVWCTGCHKDSWPRRAPGKSGDRNGSKASEWDAHPIAKADGVVAFGDATSCRSCHAAGAPDGIGRGDFPHYTPDADAMLVGSDSATGKVTGVRDASLDGVCLRCHRTGAGPKARGVGISY